MTAAHNAATTSREGLLTIAELAKQHDLPESTARYYCKQFLPFLPHTGSGKRRRYLPEVLDIFPVIIKEMQERKSSASVAAVLDSRFGRAPGAAPSPAPTGAPTPAALAHGNADAVFSLLEEGVHALKDIARALQGAPEQDRNADASGQEENTNISNEISELKESVGELRKLQEQAETLHQQDLEQLRKWLGHLAAEQAKKE